MEIEMEDVDCCSPGPILLFSRHASILDTIMPIKLLGQSHGMGTRIVQKSELLWNPVVDVASHRMPRAFVKRGSGDVGSQAAHMQHLLTGITENQALVVFPEGSRFSPEKKAKIVKKIAKSNPVAAARAQKLDHVLPVRPAGACALIESRPDIDVVFMAHTGLEGANRLEDFVGGALYKQKVRVKSGELLPQKFPETPRREPSGSTRSGANSTAGLTIITASLRVVTRRDQGTLSESQRTQMGVAGQRAPRALREVSVHCARRSSGRGERRCNVI
ncbi:MAG: hypothetical protein GY811_26135 [Myxococcales bacterium]|nr:hypothetical protein [Myxococcales bacterium]